MLTKLVRRDEVGLPGDHPLAVVVPAGAQAAVEVERIAVLEVTAVTACTTACMTAYLEVLRGADPAHAVPARRAHVGKAQDPALELDDSCDSLYDSLRDSLP